MSGANAQKKWHINHPLDNCSSFFHCQVLGFKLGVFHVELKATSRGPRLIEVNARMGGGGVRWGLGVMLFGEYFKVESSGAL